MARRRVPEEHENHERWLVSYADFITLMFAFFVVMFASSRADKEKAHQFSEAVARALEEGRISAAIGQMLGRAPANPQAKPAPAGPAPKMAELTPSLKTLTSELRKEIADGKIQVYLEARGLVISLKEAAFFPSGDDRISPEGLSIIEKVAATIRKVPNPVRLEGHTDSQPIHNERFQDNWQLSAARSIAMLQLLGQRFEIPSGRMAAVAYAETLPIADNSTEEGRARNRRVDVTILNERAASNEAQPAAARGSP